MFTRRLLPIALTLFTLACGGDDPEPPGFDIPENEWTWVDIPGTRCGDGSPTGLGLNPTTKSDKLLIWLRGGGACWEEGNCYGEDPGASYFTGYGATEFDEDFKEGRAKLGHLRRDDEGNPFRDHSMAFIPYCTGDVHIGNSIVSDKLHFVGAENLKLDIAKLQKTFSHVTEVVVTGSSAGGFGTMFSFWRFAEAFPNANVMWIDDSGPLLPLDVMVSVAIVIPTWNLEQTVHPDCTNCLDLDAPDGGPHNLIPLYAEKYPGTRGSLIQSLRDQTIVERFLVEAETLETALGELASKTAPTNPDYRYFFLEGNHHVWLDGGDETGLLQDISSGGTRLNTFIEQQLAGSSDWANVTP